MTPSAMPHPSKKPLPAPAQTVLRRFHDVKSGTCSYLIAGGTRREAAMIDPVRGDHLLYLGVLEELGLNLVYVLETHLHADHVSAAGILREATGAQVVFPRGSGVKGGDVLVGDGDRLPLGTGSIEVLATPGHTPACVTYRWQGRLFTGDALLIGDCGRCDEAGGNAGQLFDSISRKLLTLPDELLVYPGHERDERWVSCVGEERRRNPFLRGISRDEFIRLCALKNEPHPAAMTENLTANRHCGLGEQA